MVFTCLTTEITDSLVNSNGEWTKPNTITSRAGVLYLQLVKRITIWSDFNRVDTFITLDRWNYGVIIIILFTLKKTKAQYFTY
jgi:hypothetical protein